MIILTASDQDLVVERLLAGQVGVLRTDTIYGLVGVASKSAAVWRIYKLKKRAKTKPLIVLIDSYSNMFSRPDEATKTFLETVWPGPASVILDEPTAPKYISGGGNTLAYRMPNDDWLRSILRLTGPLVAPSANPEGQPPARSIAQAKTYFEEAVDFIVDSGTVPESQPASKLIRFHKSGKLEQWR